MRILVTNDDGIHAHGLKVLEAIAGSLTDDVLVVAPEADQSSRALISDQIFFSMASALLVPSTTMKRSGMPFARTR